MRYLPALRNMKAHLLIISIFSIVGPAHAEAGKEQKADAPELVSPPWELYDANKDDYISTEEAEAQKMPSQTFRSLDIDRDGRLNHEEFSKAPPIKLE